MFFQQLTDLLYISSTPSPYRQKVGSFATWSCEDSCKKNKKQHAALPVFVFFPFNQLYQRMPIFTEGMSGVLPAGRKVPVSLEYGWCLPERGHYPVWTTIYSKLNKQWLTWLSILLMLLAMFRTKIASVIKQVWYATLHAMQISASRGTTLIIIICLCLWLCIEKNKPVWFGHTCLKHSDPWYQQAAAMDIFIWIWNCTCGATGEADNGKVLWCWRLWRNKDVLFLPHLGKRSIVTKKHCYVLLNCVALKKLIFTYTVDTEVLTMGFLWCSLPSACDKRKHLHLMISSQEEIKIST